MKVLVFGARGYLGSQCLTVCPGAIPSTVDIGNAQAVARELDAHKPDVVINAAGKTGRPNIDWCEDHKLETFHSNVTGPLVLLKECADRGIYWVHLGSGCIYQGDNGGRGFTEEDAPNFFGSFYSRTKAWSDQMLKEFTEPVGGRGGILVLRLRMPFDGTAGERSLISKLAKYKRILDVKNSMTYLPDMFETAKKLIAKRKTGLYNMVNPGVMSPYDVMVLYKEMVDPSHAFERLSLEDLPEVAKAARSNCRLSTEKLEQEGIILRPVEEVMREAIALRKTS
ncbi:MAG: sugar nucleotide-binding protein [Candidatus Peribacteraceae bacterium]|nr:sugar nucleotide-binding protein [Candidatus Peribacteraceae bacterium]